MDLTKANNGKAYFTDLKNLGEYIFVDFVKNRRKKITLVGKNGGY